MSEKLARFFASGTRSGWLVPAAIGALALLIDLGGEGPRLALRFDRDGLAGGQIWRLVTGHLTHLGHGHMLMDIAALGVLAFILGPYLRTRDCLTVFVLSALAIDGGLYWMNPGIEWYVGLSGVLHGYWLAGCLLALARRRWDAIAILLLLAGKLSYERLAGPVPLTEGMAGGQVVTAAHLWGAVGGGIATLAILAVRWRARSL